LGPACDGAGNTGVFAPDPNLVREVPWLNGVVPALDATGSAVVPDTPQFPPIGLDLPDPGPQKIDCTSWAQVTASPGWFDDMERTTPDQLFGLAKGWASYDDLSKFAFHTPGDATWYPGIGMLPAPWGLPAEQVPGPVCDDKPNNWALHFKG